MGPRRAVRCKVMRRRLLMQRWSLFFPRENKQPSGCVVRRMIVTGRRDLLALVHPYLAS